MNFLDHIEVLAPQLVIVTGDWVEHKVLKLNCEKKKSIEYKFCHHCPNSIVNFKTIKKLQWHIETKHNMQFEKILDVCYLALLYPDELSALTCVPDTV